MTTYVFRLFKSVSREKTVTFFFISMFRVQRQVMNIESGMSKFRNVLWKNGISEIHQISELNS